MWSALFDPRKLSREQGRVLDEVVRRSEHAGVSAITLLEIALLGEGRKPICASTNDLLHQHYINLVRLILRAAVLHIPAQRPQEDKQSCFSSTERLKVAMCQAR